MAGDEPTLESTCDSFIHPPTPHEADSTLSDGNRGCLSVKPCTLVNALVLSIFKSQSVSVEE